jgi:hypothetical protein
MAEDVGKVWEIAHRRTAGWGKLRNAGNANRRNLYRINPHLS